MSWSLPGGSWRGDTESRIRIPDSAVQRSQVKSAFRVSTYESTNLNNHVNAGQADISVWGWLPFL